MQDLIIHFYHFAKLSLKRIQYKVKKRLYCEKWAIFSSKTNAKMRLPKVDVGSKDDDVVTDCYYN